MNSLRKFIKDEKGNSMLLMTIALSTILLLIFALHLDIDKVIMTKITISSVADMAAREASNMINAENSQVSGKNNLDQARVKARVDEVFNRHKDLFSRPITDIQVTVSNGSEISVIASIDIQLSNYIGKVTIKGRGNAKIQSL